MTRFLLEGIQKSKENDKIKYKSIEINHVITFEAKSGIS
jgi:hypothetical protein